MGFQAEFFGADFRQHLVFLLQKNTKFGETSLENVVENMPFFGTLFGALLGVLFGAVFGEQLLASKSARIRSAREIP